MSRLVLSILAICLLCVVAPAMGAAYTWTGNGDGTSFDDAGNWDLSGLCGSIPCYPKTAGDDATFEDVDVTVEMVTVTIDDVIMKGTIFGPCVAASCVVMDPVSGSKTLTVDSLSLNGRVTLTLEGGAVVDGS